MPSTIRPCALAAAAAWLAVAGTPLRATAAFDLEVIAYSGGPVPGLPGAVFDSLYTPAAPAILNDARQLAFWGELQVGPGGVTADRTTGLWGPGPDGTLALLAREGDPVPGDPGGRIFEYVNVTHRVALGASGHVAAQFANDFVLASEAGLEGILLDGLPLPGMPPPYENETATGPESFSLDPTGRLAFTAGSPPLATGVFLWDGGPAWPLVFFGDPVPGLPSTQFWYMGGAVFAGGDGAAHHAELLQAGVYLTASVWINDGISAGRLLARVGDPVPGGPAGTSYVEFTPVLSNGTGDVALFAVLGGAPACGSTPACLGIVLVRGDGEPEKVVMSGDPAPGAPQGAIFQWVERPDLNAAGQLAFVGWLTEGMGGVTAGNQHGVWGPAGAGFVLRARAGDPAPGVPGRTYGGFSPPELNARGEMLFDANLASAAGGEDGVFFVKVDGSVEAVLHAGETIEVAPGDVRSVLHVRTSELSYGAVPRRALNAAGDVALTVEFDDGSSAVVLARRRPAPRACGLGFELALLLAPPWLAHRSRNRESHAA